MSHLFCKSLVPDMFRINGLMENREREEKNSNKERWESHAQNKVHVAPPGYGGYGSSSQWVLKHVRRLSGLILFGSVAPEVSDSVNVEHGEISC